MERLIRNGRYLQGDPSDAYLNLIGRINHLDDEALQNLQDDVMRHINGLYGDFIEENLKKDPQFAHLFEIKLDTEEKTVSLEKKIYMKNSFNFPKKRSIYKIVNRTEPTQLLKKIEPKSRIIKKTRKPVLKNVAYVKEISRNISDSYSLDKSELLESSTEGICGSHDKSSSSTIIIKPKKIQFDNKDHKINTTFENPTVLFIMNQQHVENNIVKRNLPDADLHYWELNENIQQNEICFNNSDINEKSLQEEASGIEYLPKTDECRTAKCKKKSFKLLESRIEIDKDKKNKKTYNRKNKINREKSNIFVKEFVNIKKKLTNNQQTYDIEKYMKSEELKKEDRYKYYSGGHIEFCGGRYNFKNVNGDGKHKKDKRNIKFIDKKQFSKQEVKYNKLLTERNKNCNSQNKVVVENLPINNFSLETDILGVNIEKDFNFNKISQFDMLNTCEKIKPLKNMEIHSNMLSPKKNIIELKSNETETLLNMENSDINEIQLNNYVQENQNREILLEKVETSELTDNVKKTEKNSKFGEIAIEINQEGENKKQYSQEISKTHTQHLEKIFVNEKQNVDKSIKLSSTSLEMRHESEKVEHTDNEYNREKNVQYTEIMKPIDSDEISNTNINDNDIQASISQEIDNVENSNQAETSNSCLISNENNYEELSNNTVLKSTDGSIDNEDHKCNEPKLKTHPEGPIECFSEENPDLKFISEVDGNCDNKSEKSKQENFTGGLINQSTENDCTITAKTDTHEFEENSKSDSLLDINFHGNSESSELNNSNLENVHKPVNCVLENSFITETTEKISSVPLKYETESKIEQCKMKITPDSVVRRAKICHGILQRSFTRRKSLRNKTVPTIMKNNIETHMLVKITYDKTNSKKNEVIHREIENNKDENGGYSAEKINDEKKETQDNEQLKSNIYNLRSSTARKNNEHFNK